MKDRQKALRATEHDLGLDRTREGLGMCPLFRLVPFLAVEFSNIRFGILG